MLPIFVVVLEDDFVEAIQNAATILGALRTSRATESALFRHGAGAGAV